MTTTKVSSFCSVAIGNHYDCDDTWCQCEHHADDAREAAEASAVYGPDADPEPAKSALTCDFTTTIDLQGRLQVSEYVGNGRFAAKGIRPGAHISITYNRDAINCGITAYRKDGTVIDRDFVARPAAVLEATGIDVKGGLRGSAVSCTGREG